MMMNVEKMNVVANLEWDQAMRTMTGEKNRRYEKRIEEANRSYEKHMKYIDKMKNEQEKQRKKESYKSLPSWKRLLGGKQLKDAYIG